MSNRAFASLTKGASSKLFAIDLGSGQATLIGPIGGESGARRVVDIALPLNQ
jgi:hypothetical protein